MGIIYEDDTDADDVAAFEAAATAASDCALKKARFNLQEKEMDAVRRYFLIFVNNYCSINK